MNLQNYEVKHHLRSHEVTGDVLPNPLHPNINMHILHTVL